MPGFDGRGPNGEGAMTGRGRGRCSQSIKEDVNIQRENGVPGDSDLPIYGRREFRGQGRGFSQRCCGRRTRRGHRR